MDLFNLGNLTACCTCSRKADVKANGDDGNGFAQRTSDDNNKRGRLDKPQLGGVGIVFQGTDDGGLKVRLAGIPFSSPSPVPARAPPHRRAPRRVPIYLPAPAAGDRWHAKHSWHDDGAPSCRAQVSSIMSNGPAAASGVVEQGDLLVSVNGVSIDGMTDRECFSPPSIALVGCRRVAVCGVPMRL